MNRAIIRDMSRYIAVDIGGTHLRAALYSEAGTDPVKLKRIPTQANHDAPIERLIDLITSIWPDGERVDAIGLAAPGPLNPKTGVLFAAPNIPGWVDLPLRARINERFHVPTAIGNDANLAALGEWHYGAGRGHHNLIYMTVSTGIGGGIICEDRLLLGHLGLAAELGHVIILPDGPICGCGKRGHLEAVASGTAIANYVRGELAKGVHSSLREIEQPSARDVSEAAAQGDELACAAMQRAGDFIGMALANYLHIFNPTLIILGGGVSRSGDLIFEPIRAALQKYVIAPEYLQDLKVTTAELGDDAGLYGALALARSL